MGAKSHCATTKQTNIQTDRTGGECVQSPFGAKAKQKEYVYVQRWLKYRPYKVVKKKSPR